MEKKNLTNEYEERLKIAIREHELLVSKVDKITKVMRNIATSTSNISRRQEIFKDLLTKVAILDENLRELDSKINRYSNELNDLRYSLKEEVFSRKSEISLLQRETEILTAQEEEDKKGGSDPGSNTIIVTIIIGAIIMLAKILSQT